jgi:acetylglutamate kinase
MIDEKLKSSFARDIVLMKSVGMNPIVVHGGGPQIGKTLEKIGKKSEFIGGMRVTDRETMEVVKTVLGDVVNQEIVDLIHQHGGHAIGLVGKGKCLIAAKKLPTPAGVDLGFVGEVDNIDTSVIDALLNAIPVIALALKPVNNSSLSSNKPIVLVNKISFSALSVSALLVW